MADETTAADPYADHEAIAALVKKRWDEWQRGREQFVYACYRNLHFYQGRQWIRFDRTAASGWRPVRLASGTPTPVTNKFARVLDSFISMLARFEPSLTFAPGSRDAEDRAAADVGTRAIEVAHAEVDMTTHRQALAKWVGLTGGAWREHGYDPDPVHGTVDVPLERCPMCGAVDLPTPEFACASCDGGPTIPALDPATGQPKTQAMPKGALYVDACSVFEMFFDPAVTEWGKQRAYLRQKSVDVEVSKARWPEHADAIRADSMGGPNHFMETLPTLGPQTDEHPRFTLGTGARASNTKVTENYYYQRPDATYPDGLLVVMLGKTPTQFVKAGPLYTYFEDAAGARSYFLPHVFFPQHEVPGTAWPKTVANDLAPKQAARNRWEAMIEMCGKRMANPVWLIPQGSNVRNITGEPGQMIEYNGLNNAKPERIPGQSITASFIENIARIDAEMMEMGLVSEVMSGNRPAGISAGIALQILKERGESQFGPMFIKWNHAEAQSAQMLLALARQFWTEERLRKIKGRDGEWEVQKFLGADLRATIDVVPEAGITMPKSTMTDRAQFEQLATLGVINPAGNPAHQRAALKLFGMLWMQEGLEKETRNAIVENEAFEALAQAAQMIDARALRQQVQMAQAQGWPAPQILAAAETFFASMGVGVPTLRPAIDDSAVHADEHRIFARETQFKTLPEALQVLVELHIGAHDFLVGQAVQAAQAARAGTAPGGGFLAPPGPRPGGPPSTSAERGGSSPQRMEGDAREAEDRMARTG